MKKLMMLATAIAAAMPIMAETETIGSYTWTYYVYGEGVTIFNDWWAAAVSPEPNGAITIPSTLGGKPVTSIGVSAFYYCSGLTSVTIPDSVTSIGDRAFFNCEYLTSVYITDIAKWCAISFPDNCGNPLTFGANLFLNGEKVTDLIIPDGVTSIGDRAFRGCGGLTSVTIPDSVTSIGKNAFENCSSLRSIKLPSNLVSIGPNAFDNTPAYSIAQLRPLVTADGVLGGSLTSESSAGSASSGGATSGGSSSSGYVLSETVGDSTITSMTVSADTSIDSFLLADGQVFDMAIRIVNVAESAVRLSLPSDYDYETIGSADPLEIPASSTNMVTITRTAAKTFLVSRQQLRAVR